jgi:hypothetical protein
MPFFKILLSENWSLCEIWEECGKYRRQKGSVQYYFFIGDDRSMKLLEAPVNPSAFARDRCYQRKSMKKKNIERNLSISKICGKDQRSMEILIDHDYMVLKPNKQTDESAKEGLRNSPGKALRTEQI